MEPAALPTESFELIVVGGGHAGCEAALTAARLGISTALLSLNLDRIGAKIVRYWDHKSCAIGITNPYHLRSKCLERNEDFMRQPSCRNQSTISWNALRNQLSKN